MLRVFELAFHRIALVTLFEYQTSVEQYLCAALHAVNNIQEVENSYNKKINYFLVSDLYANNSGVFEQNFNDKIYPTKQIICHLILTVI